MHKKRPHPEEAITFFDKEKINTHRVRCILIDTERSADVMYFDAFIKIGYNPLHLVKINTLLVGFTSVAMVLEGLMRMRLEFDTPSRTMSFMIDFLVVKTPSAYKVILGRKTLYELGATISIPCLKIKFLIPYGVGEEYGDQQMFRDCYVLSLKGRGSQVNQVGIKPPLEYKDPEDPESHSTIELADEIEQVEIDEGKTVNIGRAVQGAAHERLVNFLRLHKEVFAWSPSNMSGIPREISEHKLYIIPIAKLVRQKKRNIGPERQRAVQLCLPLKISQG
jgi:hypothetical protein